MDVDTAAATTVVKFEVFSWITILKKKLYFTLVFNVSYNDFGCVAA